MAFNLKIFFSKLINLNYNRKAKNNIRIQIPQVPAEQCQLIMDGTGNATLKNLNYVRNFIMFNL